MSANISDMFKNPLDLNDYYNPELAKVQSQFRAQTVERDSSEANNTLSFQDMLLLMVTQLQNQTIDNTADTNDLSDQTIQMTVMQAITEMNSKVEDMTEANILSYSASLVGQTVTLPVYNQKGELVDEKEGVVTGTGLYNGQRVIFVGEETYALNQIMAVGKLPPKKDDVGTDEPGEGGGDVPPVTDPEEPEGGTDVPTTPGADETEPPKEENDSGMDVADTTVEKALG